MSTGGGWLVIGTERVWPTIGWDNCLAINHGVVGDALQSEVLPDMRHNRVVEFFVSWNRLLLTGARIAVDVVFLAVPN